ncbi:MAG: TonB-dependent receptor plug domain-containing protein [Bacteroidales bacterium]
MNFNSEKRVVPCFKRWARGSWAAFASMHRVVSIGVLSIGMSILTLNLRPVLARTSSVIASDNLSMAMSASQALDSASVGSAMQKAVLAQTTVSKATYHAHRLSIDAPADTVRRMRLDEAMVTARRSNPTRGIIEPIKAYERSVMNNKPLQTLESALKVNPAVDLRQRGAYGMQADISLYGGKTNQTMVMLNGVNFTDARTGHQSLSLPIDLEGVSGINIINGVPGIGAYAGAINIIASPEYSRYLKATISGGSYGYLYDNISAAMTKNGLSSYIVGSMRRSDGYIDNTDFSNNNLYSRFTYDSKNSGVFDLQVGYQKRLFGSNGFYSLKYPDQAEETETYLGSLRWSMNVTEHFKLISSLSYRKNYDRFELFRAMKDAPSWYVDHNYHNTDNVGATLGAEYSWVAGVTGVGVDYSYNHIYSNVLGDEMSSPKRVKGAKGVFYDHEKARNVGNAWIKHSIAVNKFIYSASLNVSKSSYGDAAMWSLASKYETSDALSFDASITRSMRLPTFTDLYYTTSTHIANDKLDPEKALTYMANVNYGQKVASYSRLKLHAGLFYRQGDNIIDWVKPSAEAKWESKQITSMNTFGAILGLNYAVKDGSKSFLQRFSLSYAYTKSDKNANNYISKTAMDYLRGNLSCDVDFRITDELIFDVMSSWYDRVGSWMDLNSNIINYKPYCLTNARLSWKVENRDFLGDLPITIFANADNIFDVHYLDFGGLPQMGFSLTAGVSITIK